MVPAVLITGGGRRLGAAMARAFAALGWHVVIHHGAASRQEAQALATSLPSAECVECNLEHGRAAVAMIGTLAKRLGDWPLLINCAAVFKPDHADRLDHSIFTEAMAVNAEAPVRIAQAFLKHAKAAGGKRVIHVTDMKVANPNPDFMSYSLAKFALAGAVRMQAMDQHDPATRIYGLAPGALLPSHDQAAAEHETSGRMNLLQRLTTPDELAQAALWLAQGWLASGETLFVDSGQHLLAQPRDVLYLARG